MNEVVKNVNSVSVQAERSNVIPAIVRGISKYIPPPTNNQGGCNHLWRYQGRYIPSWEVPDGEAWQNIDLYYCTKCLAEHRKVNMQGIFSHKKPNLRNNL